MKDYNTREYTSSELDKYLSRFGVSADIKLGFFSDFGLTLDVAAPFFDDAAAISIKERKGYIAGSPYRCLLPRTPPHDV